MDPQLVNRVDYLYRSCKQMPLLFILSLIVPVVLPFVVPLCIAYAVQCVRLLKELDRIEITALSGESGRPMGFEGQVKYLRDNGVFLYGPIIIAVVIVGLAVAYLCLVLCHA